MSKNAHFYELNKSKSYQILKNLSVLENIDQTAFVKYIFNILRSPVQTSRQLQCN